MSEQEKLRALTLVAILTVSLVGLFSFRSEVGAGYHPSHRDSLELCAASKGAICDEAPAKQLVKASWVVNLGHIVVTASRLPEPAPEAAQVAFLGSITVTAPRA